MKTLKEFFSFPVVWQAGLALGIASTLIIGSDKPVPAMGLTAVVIGISAVGTGSKFLLVLAGGLSLVFFILSIAMGKFLG